MRRNLCGISLPILATLFGFGLASSAMAQVITPPATTNPGANSAHAQMMGQLRAAHKLLAQSDHDYQGHRAKAAEEVRNAIKLLSYNHHHHKNGQSGHSGHAAQSGTPATKTAPALPQATSDAQLQQAQQLLNGVLTQLNSNHPKAAGNVKAAIVEINTALAIK